MNRKNLCLFFIMLSCWFTFASANDDGLKCLQDACRRCHPLVAEILAHLPPGDLEKFKDLSYVNKDDSQPRNADIEKLLQTLLQIHQLFGQNVPPAVWTQALGKLTAVERQKFEKLSGVTLDWSEDEKLAKKDTQILNDVVVKVQKSQEIRRVSKKQFLAHAKRLSEQFYGLLVEHALDNDCPFTAEEIKGLDLKQLHHLEIELKDLNALAALREVVSGKIILHVSVDDKIGHDSLYKRVSKVKVNENPPSDCQVSDEEKIPLFDFFSLFSFEGKLSFTLEPSNFFNLAYGFLLTEIRKLYDKKQDVDTYPVPHFQIYISGDHTEEGLKDFKLDEEYCGSFLSVYTDSYIRATIQPVEITNSFLSFGFRAIEFENVKAAKVALLPELMLLSHKLSPYTARDIVCSTWSCSTLKQIYQLVPFFLREGLRDTFIEIARIPPRQRAAAIAADKEKFAVSEATRLEFLRECMTFHKFTCHNLKAIFENSIVSVCFTDVEIQNMCKRLEDEMKEIPEGYRETAYRFICQQMVIEKFTYETMGMEEFFRILKKLKKVDTKKWSNIYLALERRYAECKYKTLPENEWEAALIVADFVDTYSSANYSKDNIFAALHKTDKDLWDKLHLRVKPHLDQVDRVHKQYFLALIDKVKTGEENFEDIVVIIEKIVTIDPGKWYFMKEVGCKRDPKLTHLECLDAMLASVPAGMRLSS